MAPLRHAVPFLFASDGKEPRRRRVADAALLAASLVVLLLAGLVATGVEDEPAVADALGRLLGWLDPLWRIAYGTATGVCVVVLIVAAVGRRHALLRDVALAVAATLALGEVLGCNVDGTCPTLRGTMWSLADPTFPALRIALVSAVLVVAAPDLTRPARDIIAVVVGLSAVGSVVLGPAYPSHALGGVAFGWAVGAALRLVFGSSAGVPDRTRVSDALSELGIASVTVGEPQPAPTGASRYAVRTSGAELVADVHGRDARDSQLAARLWRTLWYREPAPAAGLTRRGQVEHEALMLYSVAHAGIAAPAVAAAGVTRGGDALLVTEQVAGPRVADIPPEDVDDELLDRLWHTAATLRDAGIGHGALNLDAFVLSAAAPHDVVLVELGGARLDPTPSFLCGDLAELLVASAVAVGDDRAIAAATRALPPEALTAALPFVQRPALSEPLREAVHQQRLDLAELRNGLASAVGSEPVDTVQLRRLSLTGLLLTVLLLVAVYLMIGQVADIGLDAIAQQFGDARWAWLVLGLLIAQLPMLGEAVSITAAAGMPLPLGPTMLVQASIKFLNLTVPSVAGRLALTMRFLSRQGGSPTIALTLGAIDGLANFAVQLLVLAVVLPGLHLQLSSNGDGLDVSRLVWLGAAGIGLAVVSAVVFAVVPALRAKVWPALSAGLANLRGVATDPRRIALLLAGNALAQLFYALALGAAVRAFGGDASVGDLLFVNTAVSLFAGMVPVPGGVGIAEAGLVASLTAVGVPQVEAVAAATSYRVMTSYLPPIWGFLSLRWLTRHGYV